MSLPLSLDVHLADLLIALVLLLYILDDVRRGALFGLVDLAGFALALLAALLLYAPLAGLLVERTPLPYALAKPIAFGLVWIATDLLLGQTLRRALARPARMVGRSALGRLFGIFTGAARGGLAVMLALSVIAALPLPEPVTRAARESRAAEYLAHRAVVLQTQIANVLGDAVQETVGMLTVRPDSGERVNLRFTVQQPRVDETAEARMLELVNAERARVGLATLNVDTAIREVARDYSSQMFRDGYFSHFDLAGGSPFDRMRRGGVRFSAAGENLALAPTVDRAHEGLMNSPGHRANILNGRFRRVGIGVADGGMHGKMFTQNFAD